eukprot:239589-Pelagomonas_calceolata.AAC.1
MGAGTIHNDYTIKLLINLGQAKQKAKSLASRLSCHAVQGFKRGKGGGAGRVAVESRRRRVWASRSMADNPPDPQ